MSANGLNLIHHTALPRNGQGRGAPLLLLLHGFGANEDDLFSLAPYVDGRFLVISPRAPIVLQPASHAWFNLGFSSEGILIDPREVESARRTLCQFIEGVIEQYQVDPTEVYLLGFSQGAMVGLSLALLTPGLAAGVVALSGRVITETIAKIPDPGALAGLPILVTHGTNDVVLPIHHGRETRRLLTELPVELTYREYPIGHEISYDCLQDVNAWLTNRLDLRNPSVIN